MLRPCYTLRGDWARLDPGYRYVYVSPPLRIAGRVPGIAKVSAEASHPGMLRVTSTI
jgi:hypothetical protein